MIPIPDAPEIARVALFAALSPLCGTYNGHPKAYWTVAEQGAPFPLIVFQSQDGGGQDASFLGSGGWQGEIAVRALATSPNAAAAQLAGVPEALGNLDLFVWRTEASATPSAGNTIPLEAIEVFTIRAIFLRPLVLPPKDGVWTAGQIYRIHLYRA